MRGFVITSGLLFSLFVLSAAAQARETSIADVTKFLKENVLERKFDRPRGDELIPDYNGQKAIQEWSRIANYENLVENEASLSVDYVVTVNSKYFEVDADGKKTDKLINEAVFTSKLVYKFKKLPKANKLVGYVSYASVVKDEKPVDMTGTFWSLEVYLDDQDQLHLDLKDVFGRTEVGGPEGTAPRVYAIDIAETISVKDGVTSRRQQFSDSAYDAVGLQRTGNANEATYEDQAVANK